MYNGNGKQNIIIGGKIPDYVRMDGKKQVIEVFGTYWHNEEEEEERIEHYRKYGYDCLVIWEWDCYLWDKLKPKLGSWIET